MTVLKTRLQTQEAQETMAQLMFMGGFGNEEVGLMEGREGGGLREVGVRGSKRKGGDGVRKGRCGIKEGG
jgi:hypothetical protein